RSQALDGLVPEASNRAVLVQAGMTRRLTVPDTGRWQLWAPRKRNQTCSPPLTAARVSPAVPARVARPSPHHPPTAPCALHCVFPVVEERRLPWRRRFHRRCFRRRLALQRVVRRG